LAKVAYGAFADNGFVSGRQRRDFAGLRTPALLRTTPAAKARLSRPASRLWSGLGVGAARAARASFFVRRTVVVEAHG
jgi:hypothetical protein